MLLSVTIQKIYFFNREDCQFYFFTASGERLNIGYLMAKIHLNPSLETRNITKNVFDIIFIN